MTGNPGDTFHIKGIADEVHYHDKLEQKIGRLELLLAELRAEWDEFIAANLAVGELPSDDVSMALPIAALDAEEMALLTADLDTPAADPDCQECGFGLPRHDTECSHAGEGQP